MSLVAVFGAALLSFSCFAFGWERGRREKERILAMEGLIAFVTFADEQISTFRTPLQKIYKDFNNAYLNECGFCRVLEQEGLCQALETIENLLPAGALEECYRFAAALGGGYSEGQQSLCKYTLSKLCAQVDELREGLSEKIKMYRLLPLLFAACIIILLI